MVSAPGSHMLVSETLIAPRYPKTRGAEGRRGLSGGHWHAPAGARVQSLKEGKRRLRQTGQPDTRQHPRTIKTPEEL